MRLDDQSGRKTSGSTGGLILNGRLGLLASSSRLAHEDEAVADPAFPGLPASGSETRGPAASGSGRARPEPHALYNVSKRAIDFLGGLVMVVLVAPVVLSAALAVAVAYRTNPFYVSTRVGYGSQPFPMLKIKTMRDGADSEVPEHLNETGGPTFKATNDPRITGIGRVLRVTSIDEMPQFLNVVWGQMSLVGPRPALPGEVVHYSGPQLERLSVKPGITCIWQVSGRSDIPFRTWMAMDRVYVRRRSLWLDVWLLLRTPWVVLVMRGAR